MVQQLKNFIKVWVLTLISVSYCYYLSSRIKSGVLRLLSVLPVCLMFLAFPLFFSNVHFSFIISFFLSGLATSKLVLFAFDKNPLSPLPLTLSKFISLTCFPIKLQQNPKSQQNPNSQTQNRFIKWLFFTKVAILGVLLFYVYNYRRNLSQIVLLGLYSLHLYLEIEILLTLIKFFVTITLGFDLEPQFNEPYLSTSLHDFWGHRWNLMVSEILKLGIYLPIRNLRVSESHGQSSEWDIFMGVLATFLVSGVAHELFFFYLTREKPTWEVTLFFVLHGICTGAEVAIKRRLVKKQWRVSSVVSRLMTVGFVFVTGVWLFAPQPMRKGVMERFVDEALFFIDIVKTKLFFIDFVKEKLFV